VTFTVFPAVDLKDGKCVQLLGGDPKNVSISIDDPILAAREWVEQGAGALHLVDLDGALKGVRVNAPLVRRILTELDAFTQLGGGIRDSQSARELLDTTLDRVIIGTAALREPEIITEISREFGAERVMASIDSAGGEVVCEGWKKPSGVTPMQWGETFKDMGAGSLLYTDVDREGRLDNVDTAVLGELVNELDIPIVFAGGVTTLDDVEAVRDAGASGVVIGSAIYAKKISLPDALELQED
jgi:phosphoribosylformimino-5-aminoimidazole carboxamide ribotide isomerase